MMKSCDIMILIEMSWRLDGCNLAMSMFMIFSMRPLIYQSNKKNLTTTFENKGLVVKNHPNGGVWLCGCVGVGLRVGVVWDGVGLV
jgi:hypothetical protein